MWAGKGTEKEEEGLRGFWKRLKSRGKTFDEIIMEYLTLNPLYSSYKIDTGKEDQFAEYLRFVGYGEYGHADIDNALLGALAAWVDQDHDQVCSVMRAMWNAILPAEEILMVDWLRNAILARCQQVLAADPDV